MKLAVLLSGTGRTLENLLYHKFNIVQVISSNPVVRGVQIAKEANLPIAVSKNNDEIFSLCDKADLVCLAGFLLKLNVPDRYKNKIINIHPSLLPSFGGKGMYGHHVHEAVLARGCKVSGCTVHYVDNEYDHGPIIIQRAVNIAKDETPESLAAKVFVEECIAYPEAIFQIACPTTQKH